MRLERLREEVLEANLALVREGLVRGTFGNASGCAREAGLVVIKPSGVPFEQMRPADMVVTDLDGKIVEGALRPSSDLETHLVLYRAFGAANGVVHTHSRHATAWAQAGLEIPCFGTTHADCFYGPVPVTDALSAEEIQGAYEENTGLAIVRRFGGLDPAAVTSVLVRGHGPFCWGNSATEAAHNAVMLEEVAALATLTLSINPQSLPLQKDLLDRHFLRKHGAGSYYGQSTDEPS